MLTAGDVLAKTLAKSQKITFLSQKNNFRCFFLLTAGDALMCTQRQRNMGMVGQLPYPKILYFIIRF